MWNGWQQKRGVEDRVWTREEFEIVKQREGGVKRWEKSGTGWLGSGDRISGHMGCCEWGINQVQRGVISQRCAKLAASKCDGLWG
jgi:hypothetical protein